ncbi:MAG TPA: division/cell wall cluster transcriptional repressor MraZ [candidate division WWE3 bacterium]|uniref:Transcriptional regulator MraZ n=1 Tax=candidate division WWE3 bacterium TaxID=2053526 RepID=A0A7V5J040_UNCKA|nr:division/cell wall cluster transcriptional repressor MraZ [candidate division WWE3 bacterium]
MVNNGDTAQSSAVSAIQQLFLGEYRPNMVSGSRMALPKQIREALCSDKLVLSRGFERCIFGFSQDFWRAESKKALAGPISDKQARLLRRYMFSGAFEVSFDKQGRVVVPKNLLDYAGIKVGEEVLLIGAGDHFEIWNKKAWKKNLKNIERDLDL